MSVHRGGDIRFQIPARETLEPGCAGTGCDPLAIVTDPIVVATLVCVGLLLTVATAYIRDAKATCRTERRRVVDERDAFEEFSDRVAALRPATARETSTEPVRLAAPDLTADMPVADGGRGRVLTAYRDTVVSLPHYQAEYDETVGESLAAELGEDTAVSLASNETLSPGLQSALVDRSRRAAAARESLAAAIDVEIDRLERAGDRVADVDRRRERLVDHLAGLTGETALDASIDVWERLDALEAECDAVAADRQAQLSEPPAPMRASGPSPPVDVAFTEYLYEPSSGPDHPVLAAVAAAAARLRRDRDRVAARIAES
jgi:hypothetical protein